MIQEIEKLLIPYKEFTREELINISGIYCIYNTLNYKVYIGQSNNIGLRISMHLKNIEDGLYFHNALKKYGFNSFKIYLLEAFNYIDKKKQNISEIYFINKFKSNNPIYGYNLTCGGEGHLGTSLSDETKLKLKEKHKKPCYAYNYISKEFFEANDAKLLTKLLINKGFTEVTYSKIKDASNGSSSYTGDFLVARNMDTLQEKIKNFIPIKKKKVFLYNYKQQGDILEFNSTAESDTYLISCGYKINKGHSSTALNKNNRRIKDFLIASTKTELLKLISENPFILYFYNIEHKFILTFETISGAVETLKQLGFKTNETSVSKCKLGNQRQTAGFIVGRSKEELLKRIEYYTQETIQSTINYIKEYNLQDSQDTLNWMDNLNKMSVTF